MIAEMINLRLSEDAQLLYEVRYFSGEIHYGLFESANQLLVKWAMCKYKRFIGHRRRAEAWLRELVKREPSMFPH